MMQGYVDPRLTRAQNALATVQGQYDKEPCKHTARVLQYWTSELQKLKDANNDIHG